MNKMLKREVGDILSKTKYNVSFFEDDSVDALRLKIASSVESHPDRLFILVGLKLPGDYYTKDPRRWEKLFERLSYNGKPLEQEIFTEFQAHYRTPHLAIPFRAYDRVEWMSMPEALRPLFDSTEFIEYRIFGVEEQKSFILPLSTMSSPLPTRIASVKLPIPENSKLFTSFYDGEEVVRFLVRPYDDEAEGSAPVYYPLLRTTTPPVLTEESIRLLNKNSKLLDDLLKLKAPEPENITLVRCRFYVPWVETDFGSAIKTRFEQIFYGLTVSKENPYIGIFTSKDQVSRHKFFTEDAKAKKPFLDMGVWGSWWSVKPARNIPTILLFRGKSKTHFDRIAITATDMIITTHRPDGNDETVDQLKRQIVSWIDSLDAILPFLSESDIDLSRWELQDMSYIAKYADKIEDFDLLRFGCINTVFDMSDKTKSQFSLLRTDHSNNGLSAIEVKIVQMMKEGAVSPADLAVELSVTPERAKELMAYVKSRVEDDPRIAEKSFRGYPTLRLGPDYVIVSAVSEIEKSIKYSNLLRHVLSNVESDELDEVCPKKGEKVAIEAATIPTDTLEVDAALVEELGDLFGELEQDEDVSEIMSISESVAPADRVSTDQRQKTMYKYFADRLRKFDPVTFDPIGSKYPKKCEQKHQPIILNDDDAKRLKDTPYDITGKEVLQVENPDGTVVCPEYWCMRDQIPLQDSQLNKEDGEVRCPVCNGKLQTRTTDNPREFPLVKRESGFVFPGFTDYKSPRNGRNMPCCFKTSKSKKNEKVETDQYYILGEIKPLQAERIAFLPQQLLQSLKIKEPYELFKTGTRRLMAPNKGYFRVGLGHPSEILPKFLGLKTKIPSPREALETILKCSFLHTWSKLGTDHLDAIDGGLKKIPAFEDDDVLREGLSKVISGIDDAFHKKELSKIDELEYSALALQCDVFRIFVDTAKLGCMFYAPMVRPRSCGIIVLQRDDEVDILAYTERKTRGFEFAANIFKSPFTKETYAEVEKLRNASCFTNIPSYSNALDVMQEILPIIDGEDYQIVLDPFGRGQAFYVPDKAIIPFQSTPLPNVMQSKIRGYKDIPTENLPDHNTMVTLLETAQKIHPGYAFNESLFNNDSQKVELLLESGLRIPVRPLDAEPRDTGEVIETVRDLDETNLVFGPDSEELRAKQKDISYSSEVYDFLLFQLTNDVHNDDRELLDALRAVAPDASVVGPLLEKWFTESVQFNDITDPKQFVSKIRKPCDEKCDSYLCGWDGDTCKVQVNSTIKQDKIFHRLLTTLVENSKIRSMVLDGRTTPFFSTILYLELPHELIVSDNDLPG